ncbi:MAG: WS/DGAT domain-containing protein [Methanomicrobiales archaeon]|nr:WS/DGAT domain-containing protein [Methanomicrobiales archaeon]
MHTDQRVFPASPQDQMQAIARAYVDQQIHCVVSFRGRLDIPALKSALRALASVEPSLGCQFTVRGGKGCWELREDAGGDGCLSTVCTDTPDAAVQRFAAGEARAERDPLVQALLVRSDSCDTLCLKVNHVVSDAAGVKEIACLLGDLYSRYLSDGDYRPLRGTFRDRSPWQLLQRAGLWNLLRSVPAGMPAWPRFRLPCRRQGRPGGAFALRTVGPEQFRQIRRRSKAAGATINDVLLTAFFRGLCRTLDPPQGVPLPVQVSVDMRYLLPEGEKCPICNLCGALFPAFAWQPDEPFDATLARVKERMDRCKKVNQGLASMLFASGAMMLGYRTSERLLRKGAPGKRTYPLLSNIGIIDEKRLRFGTVPVSSAYFLSPIMLGSSLMMVVSTFRETMTFSIGYNPGSVATECIEGLIGTILQELSSFA